MYVVQHTTDEAVLANVKVAVVHKNLQDAEVRKHLLRSAATLHSFTSVKDAFINHCLTEAAKRGTVLMDVDLVNLVKGKGKKGETSKDGQGKRQTEKGTGQEEERRCFSCDGKGKIKSKFLRKSSTTRRRATPRAHRRPTISCL